MTANKKQPQLRNKIYIVTNYLFIVSTMNQIWTCNKPQFAFIPTNLYFIFRLLYRHFIR